MQGLFLAEGGGTESLAEADGDAFTLWAAVASTRPIIGCRPLQRSRPRVKTTRPTGQDRTARHGTARRGTAVTGHDTWRHRLPPTTNRAVVPATPDDRTYVCGL